MTDRLYDIIKYEYARDVGRNMIEFYVIPDDDLILYLHSIPKLEPQIYISLNGYEIDTKVLFQCNYYANADAISSFYQTDTNYLVFTIFTNKANRIYKYISFPRSGIKQKVIPQDPCNERTYFKGSKNPPLAIYNPLRGRFQRPKKPKDTPTRNGNKKKNYYWDINACSHGVCKAEQTTEPPLLNSLVDLSDTTSISPPLVSTSSTSFFPTVEYFQPNDTIEYFKDSSQIVCFNKTKIYLSALVIIIILVLILFRKLRKQI